MFHEQVVERNLESAFDAISASLGAHFLHAFPRHDSPKHHSVFISEFSLLYSPFPTNPFRRQIPWSGMRAATRVLW